MPSPPHLKPWAFASRQHCFVPDIQNGHGAAAHVDHDGPGDCAGDLVVVSPDVGGVARARAFAKKLSDAPLAIVDKRRSAHNVSEVMNVIGEVRGKVAVLVDDMIDTAGQLEPHTMKADKQ